MTKDFIFDVQFGVRKIWRLPEGGSWTNREIVADFVEGGEGDFAFACFKQGLAQRGGSLRDGKGFYHVGTIGQLTGSHEADARFVSEPSVR